MVKGNYLIITMHSTQSITNTKIILWSNFHRIGSNWVMNIKPNTVNWFETKNWYLNCSMLFVRSKTNRTKGSIVTIQAIHIAFTLVWIWVDFALNKETCLKKWLQPWWPLVFFFIVPSSTSLIPKTKKSNFFNWVYN